MTFVKSPPETGFLAHILRVRTRIGLRNPVSSPRNLAFRKDITVEFAGVGFRAAVGKS